MKTAETISQEPFIEGPQFTDTPPSPGDIGAREAEWKQLAHDRYLLARAWVRDNPVPAIGIAVATGFVVGRIFRR